MNSSKILCLVMIMHLFFTSHLSFGHALVHGDGIEGSSIDAVSTRKGIDDDTAMVRGRKLMNGDHNGVESENVEEFGKKMTKMMPKNTPIAKTKARESVDEDGLVAYTADYWRARHHPPKNN
ncbi:PREDICTED: root meristem growth factor 3 [Tarenaya hassleriana]|uniref:root meristem growth factor 3 n=1 Tax=Tarenaya hassleriana TaxID=28532 RepID=UPI00053C8E1F|nr:PREDICTED: root meristem growth factor 3 [Tarenaya hassleriana]